MPKKLIYLIVPNFDLASVVDKFEVFEHKNLDWKHVQQISGFWTELPYREIFSHKTLLKQLKQVLTDLTYTPCDYHKDRLFLYSNLYHELKVGETLFVQYD